MDTIGEAGSPCIPGVTVDRRRGAPIFVSEPTFEFKDSWGNTVSVGAIGEIDPKPVKCPTNPLCTCVRVRHWPLPAGITGPRQLRVDDMGRLWGITTDGHLFSLDIDRHCDQAKLTRHDPLGPGDEDLFAVAPNDGIIGFTDSNNNKVSVLFPQRVTTTVSPAVTFIQPVTKTISGKKECADPQPSTVTPRVSTALGVSYTNPGDGSYVETDISTGMSGSTTPSMFPTGMAPDGTWKTGAFFYGVTLSDPTGKTNRIGHFAIKIDKHKEVECRRGDDDDDHDGIDNEHDDDLDGDGIPNSLDDDDDNDGTPDVLDDDKNGDGIEDKYQSPGSRETKRSDNGQMAPGEAKEYDMEYDEHSVLMLAVVEAADLTTPLAIDIVDPNGVVVLSTPPAVGKAVATATPALPGVYTVRVRNAGLTPVTYKTTLVGRQIQY